jgi:putative transposase
LKDKVDLSSLGVIASHLWLEIPEHHAGVELDEFIIMPNHVHGVIIL